MLYYLDEARLLATSRLFTSGYGVDILTKAVAQYIDTRLYICRDLLFLINQRTDHGLNEGENVRNLSNFTLFLYLIVTINVARQEFDTFA